jgi:hypothetical protein
MARNYLVERFLETDAEWLWFVDSDAHFLPPTLARLLSWDVPVVGAVGMMKKKPGVLPNLFGGFADDEHGYEVLASEVYQFVGQHYDYETNDSQIIDPAPEGSLVPVSFTGCHCLLVRREVIEDIDPPWFSDRLGLEDKFFCLKAGEAGYQVYVDMSVLAGHASTDRMIGAFDFMSAFYFGTKLEEHRANEREKNGTDGTDGAEDISGIEESGDGGLGSVRGSRADLRSVQPA